MGTRRRPERRELYACGILAVWEDGGCGHSALERYRQASDARIDAYNGIKPAHAGGDPQRKEGAFANASDLEEGVALRPRAKIRDYRASQLSLLTNPKILVAG